MTVSNESGGVWWFTTVILLVWESRITGAQGQPRLHSKTLSQQQGQNKSQVSYQLQAPDLTKFSFTNTKNCLFLGNSAGPRGQRNKPNKQHSLLWGRLHFDNKRQTINKLGNP